MFCIWEASYVHEHENMQVSVQMMSQEVLEKHVAPTMEKHQHHVLKLWDLPVALIGLVVKPKYS